MENSSLYSVSIEEDEEHYYGTIEILEQGIKIYSEDMNYGDFYYFEYQDITLTKLYGENSFKLKIETDHKELIVNGLFSDFFQQLKEYTQIQE